jgi:signal transduction histidine kinase
LGLYIVKEVLDKHHASIRVKDNRPAGSVFEVVFGLT